MIYKKIYKKVVNAYTLIIVPYVVILLINNHFATKLNFIKINEDTQLMIFIGMICFFVGTIVTMTFRQRVKMTYQSNEKNFQEIVKIENFLPYIKLVLAIRIIQILILYSRYGLSGLMANDFELMLTRGWVSHLLLSIFPLMIILFYKWLENKRNKEYFILYFVYFVLAFIETEKAQVLSLIVGTFIYCVCRNHKYLIKGLFIILAAVAVLFVGNYVVKLTLQGYASDVEGVYYTYRLWNYIAGGIISSNYVTSASNVPTNAFDFLIECIFAFPNMFINKLAGSAIGPDVYQGLPRISSFVSVTHSVSGFRYQNGNVVSTMTMMWGNGNLFAFTPVCILWGMISEYFFGKFKRAPKDITLILCVCFMTFSFFSFFSSYYIIASFYERLLWCVAIGWFAQKKIKVRL